MKTLKKIKSQKFYLLLAVLAVVVVVIVIFALLFHKPSSYKPLDLPHDGQVSLYLTHQLLPQFYNNVQYSEPFELVVTQEGINDIVARLHWPQKLAGVSFSAPMIIFKPGRIVLMGMVLLEGAEFIATLTAEPHLDAEGLLSLQVISVELGAVDITPLAAVLTEKIYQMHSIDGDSLWEKAVRSVLNDEPFEPVFEIEDKKVRLEKIKIERKKLILLLTPVFE